MRLGVVNGDAFDAQMVGDLTVCKSETRVYNVSGDFLETVYLPSG